jgi:MFS family permease
MAESTKAAPRLAALRYRDYRLIWTGELVSTIGTQMQMYAVNWHIFQLLRGQTFTLTILGAEITLGGEALGLGTVGLARVIPIILFALVGGVMADAYDRRKLMIYTRIVAAIFALMLALVTLAGQETVLMIYILTALTAATTAFDTPSRQALVPHLVPKEHLANAVSLQTLIFEISLILGPALSGPLIGGFNIGVVYAINALTFFAAIYALAAIRYRGQVTTQTSGLGWAAMKEGLRFTFSTRIIRATMLLDFFATFFSSARTMLPIVAADVLHTDAVGYGLLATAQAVGSLIAGLIVALRKDIYHQGLVLLVSVGIYGLATALFGISTSFALSYFLFALVGAGDTVSTVIRGTIRQLMTPDHIRGRMVSVNMMFFMGGPQLGELEAGLVAAAWGVPVAIFTGGVATILMTAWIAWRYPRLRNYTSDSYKTEAILSSPG